MDIELLNEFALNDQLKAQIQQQLVESFGGESYKGRIYFKQRAHYRLVAMDENQLLGQLGLDYRCMKLGEEVIQVMGVIDFTVSSQFRSQGIGSAILQALIVICAQHASNIDFIVLMADQHEVYLKNGFEVKKQQIDWLGIHEHEYVGERSEVADFLLVKAISGKHWDDHAVLDMLGYMY